MGNPIKPKYPLFLRDIGKCDCESNGNENGVVGGYPIVTIEDNFNIEAEPNVFYNIKNKENDEININLEDNNNNQFLINCPCSLSFNKDINWVNNYLPILDENVKIFIQIINNICTFDYFINDDIKKNNYIIYKSRTDVYVSSMYSTVYLNYIGFIKETYSPNSDIKELKNNIFESKTSITELILPDTIEYIDLSIFNSDISKLQKVNVPKNIKHIKKSSFNSNLPIYTSFNDIIYLGNCLIHALNTRINMKDDTELIASDAINNIYNETLILPNTLKYINRHAINNAPNLTTLILNEGLLEIEDDNFNNDVYGFGKLTNVTIPSTLRRIGNHCFTNTYFMNNLPNGEIYFGKVFYKYNADKTTIKDLIIKEGTVSIQANALLNTDSDSITNIILPETLEHIGDYAFNNCYNVENIIIPNNVTELSRYAFVYCTGLKTITTAKGTYHVGEYNVEVELANGEFVSLIIDEEMHECVLPETEILINNQGDTKQIKDLQIGDTVITNKNNNLIETTINKLVQVQHNNYLKVTLENNDILNVSLDHNICTKNGWKCYNNTISKNKECVGKLTIGDEVLTTDGLVKIISIEMINKENIIMYNIGVKEGNNYYANGICVYECDK